MSESIVTFRATVNGLIILMREEDTFDAIYEQIAEKVASAGKFFKGASISVKYRGKDLTKEQEDSIFEMLTAKTGAQIKVVEKDLVEPEDLKDKSSEGQQNKFQMKKFYFRGIEEGVTKFYRGTLRSGQSISFDGNLVVIGDVNPGGEVVATGNVTVMGALRGIVHAGADGNKDAIVVAYNLQPMLLKIADIITRSPDEKVSRNQSVPELAYVKDNMVYIDKFLPQR